MKDRCHLRRERLRWLLAKPGADALLITNPLNVTYLTGFTGDDSFLLVRERDEVLISDGRYTTQIGEECPKLDRAIRRPGVQIVDAAARVLRSRGVQRLAIEGDSMTVAARDRLAEAAPNVAIIPTSGLVERLRRTKDRAEIAEIRRAVQHAGTGLGDGQVVEAIRGRV